MELEPSLARTTLPRTGRFVGSHQSSPRVNARAMLLARTSIGPMSQLAGMLAATAENVS
jgi:hypothetical protein